MGHYTGSKNRIARRFGVNIFGRKRNPMLHKPNPPGVHGARRRKKSDFGLQLEEKQKLKAVYGMLSERQLSNYYKKASAKHGNTAQLLAEQLECRLDNIVYRLKFAPTLFAAQQLVTHGHVLVDGKKVDRRSFDVVPGMTISVKEKSRKMPIIIEALDSSTHTVPDYLSLDKENFTGKLNRRPALEQIHWPVELNLLEICDFLAHNV